MSQGEDDTVYVALGKDVEQQKLTLLWALENFPGKKFFILHVHQPSKTIPCGKAIQSNSCGCISQDFRFYYFVGPLTLSFCFGLQLAETFLPTGLINKNSKNSKNLKGR